MLALKTEKKFAALPNAATPWVKSCVQLRQDPEWLKPAWAKNEAMRKAFSLPLIDGALDWIYMTQVQVICLCELNENKYIGADYMYEVALGYKNTLDYYWDKIKENKAWNFYYINKDSGLSQDVYFILNTILDNKS